MKQQAVQYAAKKYINDRYADLGSISKLEINPNSRTILAELNLNGEPEAILLEVLRYQLVESAGQHFLRLEEVRISRPWMDAAFQKFLKDRTIAVPDFIRSVL